MAKLGELTQLRKKASGDVRNRGWLPGLDGRKIRSDPKQAYSAVATLGQGAGAVLMKAAIFLCPIMFEEQGLIRGQDYEFVMYIHDEFQVQARPDCVEKVKEAGLKAIRLAGELLQLRCPMDGAAVHGRNWKETH